MVYSQSYPKTKGVCLKNTIFNSLKSHGLTSLESRKLLSESTRDSKNISVWQDDNSGVIYIDDFYVGDDTYIEGTYREDGSEISVAGAPNYERDIDAERRLSSNLKFISGKRVLDFGCGAGDFLKLARDKCASVCGVELQQDYADVLNKQGITCHNSLDKIDDNSIDVCVSFHVLEHLPDPISTLSLLNQKIAKGGYLIMEVPHARDFLLSGLKNLEFQKFTLWSQHLILHTRESLIRFLSSAGFDEIRVDGVQRYPLSNHLGWLSNGEPGGHKSQIAMIDSEALNKSYADSLARLDSNDTLVAIAKKN